MNKYLITGGTGSLGRKLATKLLSQGHEVYIYSRDEYKQHNMASEFNNSKLKFFVGDIRDKDRTIEVFKDIDYVIHAAALKHVPVGEEDPDEVVKTNILGSQNVIRACKVNGIKKAIFISSDKACHPVNLYGMTKAVVEKLFIQANVNSETVFACVRYGNVVGSRGSVIEYILKEQPKSINITDPRMTRFWLSLDQAVNLVMYAFKKAKQGEIIVPPAPACKVSEMFTWLKSDMEVIPTGMRPGEKLHECMINHNESLHTKENQDYFVIEPELFGVKYNQHDFEYSSEYADRLVKEDFLKLI